MHVFAQGILNFEFSFFSEISTYIPFSQKNISFQNSTLKKKRISSSVLFITRISG